MEGLQSDYERVAAQFDNLFWRKITLEESIDARITKTYTCDEVCELMAKHLQIMSSKESKCPRWVQETYQKSIRRMRKQWVHPCHHM